MSSLSAFGWLQSSLGIDITGEWSSLVNLNVGGCAFSCQRKTFKCCADTSVLCKMALSSDRTVARTEDGSVIIDRDPETFRHVLNFLRANQKLILPDDFCDWELLLEDARVYELPSLAEAVRSNPKYQQRCFVDSIPSGVMLRWVDPSSSSSSSSSSSNSSSNSSSSSESEKKKQEQQQQQQQQKSGEAEKSSATSATSSASSSSSSTSSVPHIEVFPPLQLFAVDPSSGKLQFQNRQIATVDEAVSILLFTYQMHVETWHRDTIHGSGSNRIAHTIFFSKRGK